MRIRHPDKALWRRVALLLFTLLITISCSAQKLSPRFHHYGPDEYQDHRQVFNLEPDRQGGIWFGTVGNVMHYAGEEWKKIPTKDGMGVFAMDLDQKGRLWIGGHGQFGYIGIAPPGQEEAEWEKDSNKVSKKDHLQYVSLLDKVPDSLRDFNIVWQVEAFDDRVAFNGKRALFIQEKDSLYSILPRGAFFFFMEDINGELWVQDKDHGYYRIPKGSLEITEEGHLPRSYRLPDSKKISNLTARDIHSDVPGVTRKGEVLFFGAQKGLLRYQVQDAGGRKAGELEPLRGQWSGLKKIGLYHGIPLWGGTDLQDPWGASMVVSSDRSGVFLLDSNGSPIRKFDTKNGMPSNFVWRTKEGQEASGLLWSTTNKGIVHWTERDARTYSIEEKGYPGSIRAISGIEGRILIGTGQGVYFGRKTPDPLRKGISWQPIASISEECLDMVNPHQNKKVLIALAHGGVISLERTSSGWDKKDIVGSHSAYLSKAISHQGNYYLANGGRGGIDLLAQNHPGSQWKKVIHIGHLPGQVRSIEIASPESQESPNGNLSIWISFRTEGLARIDIPIKLLPQKLETVDPIRHLNFKKLLQGEKGDAIAQRYERSLFQERIPDVLQMDGRILLGMEEGLLRPVIKEEEKDQFSPFEGLGTPFSKGKYKVSELKKRKDGSILVEASGRIMLLHPQKAGTYRIDSLPFKDLGVGGAMNYFSDQGGRIWIGGGKGLVRYDPSIPKNYDRSYPCLIRQVKAPLPKSGSNEEEREDTLLFDGFYRKESSKSDLLAWKRGYEQTEPYVPSLPYTMNGIHFRFAAPFHEGQDRIQYRYKLIGFKDIWSQWTKKPEKEYTSLAEGEYRFKVQARNVYGIKSEVGEYRFRILPPWYRTWTAYSGFSVAAIGFVWLLIWINSRRLLKQKQRLEETVNERTQEIQAEKEKVETAHHELQEAHQEITESIDYAKKIQDALLRSEDRLRSHLPEHFILFEPQAKVSGDLYWMKEHKGFLYIAAMDCTGHGVPGAFMSMLGISQLNEIMSSEEALLPGELLTELRKRVVRELTGSDPEWTAKDGMDAALIRIPTQEGADPWVQFAGAQSPLFIARKGIAKALPEIRMEGGSANSSHDRIKRSKRTEDGVEVKGEPHPIGYDEHANESFSTVSLKLQKGDMLYLFSDGFPDQFGGPKGKKFRAGPFRKLLVDVHEQKAEEQKEALWKSFKDWKDTSDEEQIDDVMVIGVRL